MAQTFSKQCELCNQEDGEHFCYDCQQALCDLCRKKHEKIPSLVDHKFTNLQQVDKSSFNTKSHCESHRTEFSIYCKTCLCLVCLKCVTSIHACHEFCDIRKVVSQERQDVGITITDLKSKVQSLLDLKEKIKCDHLKKNQANAKRVLKDIAETFTDLAQMIEHKQQIKQTEVKDFEELERAELDSFLRNVDHVLNKYTKLCEQLENLLTMEHDTTFHLCYKALKHDVQNQDNIPDEPKLNQIQPFDARESCKEILTFMKSKFQMRLCGDCVDQEKQIDGLKKENKELKETIETDILQLDKLSTKLKDAESSFIAEKTLLQRELQSKIEEIEKSQENIIDLEEQLNRMKEKCEKFELENHNIKVIERGTDTLLETKSAKKGVETDEDMERVVRSKLSAFQMLTSCDIVLPENQRIDDINLYKVEKEISSIFPDIFCFRSKDQRTLTLKGSQYEKLQAAKTRAEFILGVKQQRKGGRRVVRVIASETKLERPDTKDFSDSTDRSRSLSLSMNRSESLHSSVSNMTFITTQGIVIKVYVGHILNQNVDCIVNATDEQLSHGLGFADVISRAAGYRLQQESNEFIRANGSLKISECCSTTAGDLLYKLVIHTVGPRWFDYADKKSCAYDLKKTIMNCFFEAEKKKMSSVALPTISAGNIDSPSGIFGVPKEVCCKQYCQAVLDYDHRCGKTSCLKEIHFIDKDSGMIQMIQKEFSQQCTICPSIASVGNTVSNPSSLF